MVAYSFGGNWLPEWWTKEKKREVAYKQLRERIKTTTIRDKNRCKQGDRLQIYWKQRTKECNKIIEEDPTCKRVDTIIMDAERRKILLYDSGRWRELTPQAIRTLALGDGFQTEDDFWKFFSTTKERYIVAWGENALIDRPCTACGRIGPWLQSEHDKTKDVVFCSEWCSEGWYNTEVETYELSGKGVETAPGYAAPVKEPAAAQRKPTNVNAIACLDWAAKDDVTRQILTFLLENRDSPIPLNECMKTLDKTKKVAERRKIFGRLLKLEVMELIIGDLIEVPANGKIRRWAKHYYIPERYVVYVENRLKK